MWRVFVLVGCIAAGAAIGNVFAAPYIGAFVGLAVGACVSFPRVIGDIAEGIVDVVD